MTLVVFEHALITHIGAIDLHTKAVLFSELPIAYERGRNDIQ
jgi:hypothetical protein